MTEERRERFKLVAFQRQLDVVVVLENITDMHNIGAVMRTCDAVGVARLFILNTEEELRKKNLILGKRTTSGSRKWVEVSYFTDREQCFSTAKQYCDRILATHLSTDAQSIYETNFQDPYAIVMGNEKDGITQETLSYTTGNVIIPMMGMVQSLNISVACAVSLYEMLRQRNDAGKYRTNENSVDHMNLYEEYLERHQSQKHNRKVNPSD